MSLAECFKTKEEVLQAIQDELISDLARSKIIINKAIRDYERVIKFLKEPIPEVSNEALTLSSVSSSRFDDVIKFRK